MSVGTVNVPFTVSDTPGEATYLLAAATGAGGMTGPVGSPIYLELDAGPAPSRGPLPRQRRWTR